MRDDEKGFLGIHSATITFSSRPEYGRMLGGYFDEHPWGEFQAPLVVESPEFPGLGHFPIRFSARDEVFQIKDFSRDNLRVLLRLDAGKVDLTREGVHRKDGDFAVAWAKTCGKDRVLYNGLGHSAEVWERPDFQKMWKEMVLWTLGVRSADVTPRAKPAECSASTPGRRPRDRLPECGSWPIRLVAANAGCMLVRVTPQTTIRPSLRTLSQSYCWVNVNV